jgi:hypothetical protein
MSEVTVTRCDVCQGIKKDANKWLKAVTLSTGLYIGTSSYNELVDGNYIPLDICGEQCLQKLIAEEVKRQRTETE